MDTIERGKLLAIVDALRYHRRKASSEIWEELCRRIRGLERQEVFHLFGQHEDEIPAEFWAHLVETGDMDLQLFLPSEREQLFTVDEDDG